jgi:cytidine deaminase
MDPNGSELRVIETAEQAAMNLGDDPNHTVAAAAMDSRGIIYSGVNVYHFTGGPCAELVVLGAAAGAGAGPLITMAAAGDRDRGLIPPCGRCRQVMLDLHPDLLVAVPGESGPSVLPIRKLLPETYFWPDANAKRVLRFNKRYYDDVASGSKTVTVRWDDPIAVGPATFIFEDHPDNPTIEGEVLTIERYPLEGLTIQQLKRPSGSDVLALKTALRERYPKMPDDASVDVVTFTIASP